jgi:glycolate oxidase iron-sulfur subunit
MTVEVKASKLQAEFQKQMDYDELLNCTRCGFCQPSCPTFIETGGKESSSPRGRIALMKAVVDGKLEPDENFQKELSLCLGCRACETACPSGVRYGHLLEEARAIVNGNKQHSFAARLIRGFFFKQLLPKQGRLNLLGSLLWIYQQFGFQWIARKSRFLKLLPGNLADMESVVPKVLSPLRLWKGHKAVKRSKGSVRTAFFKGCIMDVLFFDTNERTIKLLETVGNEVVLPEQQTCCGALHAHAGERELAKQLAEKNIRAFEKEPFDYIITNAGGCGAFLVDYPNLFKDDPDWHERAKSFVSRIKDINEFLHNLDGLPTLESSEQVITYQDSCHLKHGMGVDKAPRQLIKDINGIQYVELKDAGLCCGSAGIYNMIETEMSMQLLDHKMENVKKTDACTIATSNPGCLMQMQLGIQRAGLQNKMKAVHTVDLLFTSIAKR